MTRLLGSGGAVAALVLAGTVAAVPGAAGAAGVSSPLSLVVPCGTTVPSPPPTVAEGLHESSTNVNVYVERADSTLSPSVTVDIIPSSAFPFTVAAVTDLRPGTISAGTVFDSYLVETDPVGQPTPGIVFRKTLSFTEPILGVIVQTSTLTASDKTVGHPGTTYPGSQRGLELQHSDSVTLDNANTITVDLQTQRDVDEVRILTAVPPPSTANCAPSAQPQYTMVATDGGIFAFNSPFFGSTGNIRLNQPVVTAGRDEITSGYWEVASDGGVFSFNAPFFGSTGNRVLQKPIVAMAADRTGLGYRMFAADGGVFDFGDATFKGSLGADHLNQPIVGAATVPFDTSGYWMVASDGGVFAFGSAGFHGSLGNVRLTKPIVGMVSTASGQGYWLVASDGGIFSFGDARFHGSEGGVTLNQPIVSMKATPTGNGYWLFAADGGVFAFGDAPFLGSLGNIHLNKPIVGSF
jgi:hypothetical protein